MMIGKMTLKEAERLIRRYYEKEYEEYDNFSMIFPLENVVDEDGFPYKTYYGLIKISKKIGNMLTSDKIELSVAEMWKVLIIEANLEYFDDEYEIDQIDWPFISSTGRMDKYLEVEFIKKEKNKELLRSKNVCHDRRN